MLKNLEKSKKICSNCHFLAVRNLVTPYVPWSGNTEYTISMPQSLRDKIMNRDFTWMKEEQSLFCYFNVWNQNNSNGKAEYENEILQINRLDSCFYFKFRPGMLFEAAQELEKRDASYRESAKDRKLTKRTIIIALITLITLFLDILIRLIQGWKSAGLFGFIRDLIHFIF